MVLGRGRTHLLRLVQALRIATCEPVLSAGDGVLQYRCVAPQKHAPPRFVLRQPKDNLWQPKFWIYILYTSEGDSSRPRLDVVQLPVNELGYHR